MIKNLDEEEEDLDENKDTGFSIFMAAIEERFRITSFLYTNVLKISLNEMIFLTDFIKIQSRRPSKQ